jgi:hypothetical protein
MSERGDERILPRLDLDLLPSQPILGLEQWKLSTLDPALEKWGTLSQHISS